MLESYCLPLLEVQSIHEYKDCLTRFTRRLGFEFFSASLGVDRLGGVTQFVSVHNTPVSYVASFMDEDAARKDPVMQHCKRSYLPKVWDQSTYVAAGQAGLWEHQASFGYHAGICVAMHMPNGVHFVLGVDRDQPIASDALEDGRVVADLQLFFAYAQQVAVELLGEGATPKMQSVVLSLRELECLRWTMEGKTAWEVGRILNIAEQTAARHLHNASRKLGCINKHQAVVKALHLQLFR